MITTKELYEGNILALSWKEPYASMMLHGKIETRTWKTNYRGLVLICTSQQKYKPETIQAISGYHRTSAMAQILFRAISFIFISDNKYKLGHAIAIGRLIDCRPMTWEDEEKTFVTSRGDLWCHIYQDVTAIEPIPFKGGQKWRNVSQDIINQIKFK
jgi:hypothetical protein